MGTPAWETVISQLTNLQQQNIEVRQEIEASRLAATASDRRPALRLRDPETFGADPRANIRTWIFALETYLTAVDITDDKQRIDYAVTLFRGAALEWWRHFQLNATLPRSTIALPATWEDFIATLRVRFKILSVNRAGRV